MHVALIEYADGSNQNFSNATFNSSEYSYVLIKIIRWDFRCANSTNQASNAKHVTFSRIWWTNLSLL